jgi:KaiC/GvpD/RAD55 family RecA-like ATPase
MQALPSTTPVNLPHDIHAELDALGLVINNLSAGTPEGLTMFKSLRREFFHETLNARVFSVLRELVETGNPVSLDSIQKHLESLGATKADTGKLRHELTGRMENINSDFNSTIKTLEKLSQRRFLSGIGNHAIRLASEEHCLAGHLDTVMQAIADSIYSFRTVSPSPKLLTFLTQKEIRGWKAPDDHFLIGEGLITRGEIVLIGGAPGIGKSRAALALAISGATGRDWFGIPVKNQFRTLIIQCENSRHRLKSDFDAVAEAGINLENHVLVTDCPDIGLAFSRPDFRAEVKRMIEEFKPAVVVVDPWTEATKGDKKEDYQNALTDIRSCLPKGPNAPALVIVCHTRKPQGEEKTSGRGLLNLIAGSYTIGSAARTAFVIQKASDEPDDTRRVWTCCKANNCEMPPQTAWDCSIASFEPLPDFDWTSFKSGGKPSGRPSKVREEDIRTILADGRRASKKVIVEELMETCDCNQSKAYEALKRFSALLEKDEDGLLTLKE